jgi:hypothetical protein
VRGPCTLAPVIPEFELHGASSMIDEQPPNDAGGERTYTTLSLHVSRKSSFYVWKARQRACTAAPAKQTPGGQSLSAVAVLWDGRLSWGVGARVALAVPPATLTPASRRRRPGPPAAVHGDPALVPSLLLPAVGVQQPRVDGGGQGMHRRGVHASPRGSTNRRGWRLAPGGGMVRSGPASPRRPGARFGRRWRPTSWRPSRCST